MGGYITQEGYSYSHLIGPGWLTKGFKNPLGGKGLLKGGIPGGKNRII